jgi:hypothetical protein
MSDADHFRKTDQVDESSTMHVRMPRLELETKGLSVRHLLQNRNRLLGRKGRQSRTIPRSLELQQVEGQGSICGSLVISIIHNYEVSD